MPPIVRIYEGAWLSKWRVRWASIWVISAGPVHRFTVGKIRRKIGRWRHHFKTESEVLEAMSAKVQTIFKILIAPGASQLGRHHVGPERETVGFERGVVVKASCGSVDSEGGH